MSQEDNQKEAEKKRSGFLAFIGINQNTFINQQFNRALWKCFNYYHSEFGKQYKANPNDIQIQDFFESGEVHKYENMQEVEHHCLVQMKNYTDSHFVDEQKTYVDCRKECELGTASEGKILSFVKNERCYKRCRVDFEKLTKEKVAVVFSKFVPELRDLIKVNDQMNLKKEEDLKIQEIEKEFGTKQN